MVQSITEASKSAFIGAPGMNELGKDWLIQDVAGKGLMQSIQSALAPAPQPETGPKPQTFTP